MANILNDISKTHPGLIAKLASDWYGKNKFTDWIVKKSCRTFLKKGNSTVLVIFSFSDGCYVNVNDFALNANSIAIDKDIMFSFNIETKEATKVRNNMV